MKIANSLNTNFNNSANNMRIKRLRETFSVNLFLDSKNESAFSVKNNILELFKCHVFPWFSF